VVSCPRKGPSIVITTEELFSRLGTPGFLVVDIRGAAAYNGWQLACELRGGHIPGAVNLPASWVGDASGTDIGALLEAKGIHPDKSIVLYGAGEHDQARVAQLLREHGCRDVRAYRAGMAEWAADDALPMARLANYHKLVHPQWVHDLVQGLHPTTYSGRGFLLFEVGSQQHTVYGQGHVPRAVFFDTSAIETEPLWNRVSDRDLEAALLAHGVTHDTTVVLYGRDTSAAARAANIMMVAGVDDVRLLDGGFDAWTSAGYKVETGTLLPSPASAFGRHIPAYPEYLIDTEQARAMLASERAVLVSVRSWAEYTGETSGYDYVQPKGRIAGAAWAGAGLTSQGMEGLRNVDGTMRSYAEIAANWRDWGITPDKDISFYCGTSWRASEAFFYAHLMGWERISVYDGGWHEWSADPANPVESGEPPRPNSGTALPFGEATRP
jgi:3-mercaptopyruvate sulfurtransferase SseA